MTLSYNYQELITLMENFYLLTKIKTVLYDNKLNPIAAVPYEECAFCTALRHCNEARKLCESCTTEGGRLCKAQNKLNIYKCHAGLIEAITPIRINNIIVGYMMLGQVLDKNDKKEKREEIINYSSKYIGDNAEKYFSSLVCKSDKEIKASASLMESCVCYLLMNQVISEEKGSIAFEITRYIENNLTGDLSVSALCREFKISRNTLYRIADSYLSMPIAKYIKKKRVNKASELIKEGVSVTLASELAGFCDYGYFGKVFKQITGNTPSEIKRKKT